MNPEYSAGNWNGSFAHKNGLAFESVRAISQVIDAGKRVSQGWESCYLEL